MKKYIILIFVVSIFTACRHTTGSGNIISEKRNVGSFTGVNVAGGFTVEIKNGPAGEVTLEADDNIIKSIETEVKNGQLKIRLDVDNLSDAHLRVFITAPLINKIHAAAGSDITVQGGLRESNEIELKASSGSKIKTAVDAPSVSADASSAGDIEVSGRTKKFSAESSSGAGIKAAGLLSEITDASASSGASAHVHASVTLTANASSGGNIYYSGGANAKINESSGGNVNKEN